MNINKYHVSRMEMQCSNGIGEQPKTPYIALKDVQYLYKVGCKILPFIDNKPDLSLYDGESAI